jgi:hypothetical protein
VVDWLRHKLGHITWLGCRRLHSHNYQDSRRLAYFEAAQWLVLTRTYFVSRTDGCQFFTLSSCFHESCGTRFKSSKSVFVLLHGAWHNPRCWERLVRELETAGYESVAPALPSIGSVPPTPDWSADVEIIRGTVSSLVEERCDMTGFTALHGLEKESRKLKQLGLSSTSLSFLQALTSP